MVTYPSILGYKIVFQLSFVLLDIRLINNHHVYGYMILFIGIKLFIYNDNRLKITRWDFYYLWYNLLQKQLDVIVLPIPRNITKFNMLFKYNHQQFFFSLSSNNVHKKFYISKITYNTII